MLISRKDIYEKRTDHTNYYNKYGKLVPSVTTVLKVISKDSLIQWANNLGWKRTSVKHVLDESSIVGTYVHNYAESLMTENYDKCNEILNEVNYLDENAQLKILNAIKSFKLWWNDNYNLTILECEKEMSCDLYGGTIDVIAKNIKNKKIIIDLKTSKDIYYTMYLQLAAYKNMYEINEDESIDDVAILIIDKYKGTKAKLYYLKDLNKGHISLYYETFRRALLLNETITILDHKWN